MDQFDSFLGRESLEDREEEDIDLKTGDTPAELFDNQGVAGFVLVDGLFDLDDCIGKGVELEEEEE